MKKTDNYGVRCRALITLLRDILHLLADVEDCLAYQNYGRAKIAILEIKRKIIDTLSVII